ncbi:uncharacterized protein isoform X2 [Rhodnius prolixus]|uniref:uncharacterized protein isoform X2 n=1 Tax=Rhodnius prolixus TaxID=13249 RepID=UPI003D1892B4
MVYTAMQKCTEDRGTSQCKITVNATVKHKVDVTVLAIPQRTGIPDTTITVKLGKSKMLEIKMNSKPEEKGDKCERISCRLPKHCYICVKYRRMPYNGTGMDLCYKLYSVEEQYAYGKCLQWQAHAGIKDLKLEDNIQIVDEMECTKPTGSKIKCHAYWLSDAEAMQGCKETGGTSECSVTIAASIKHKVDVTVLTVPQRTGIPDTTITVKVQNIQKLEIKLTSKSEEEGNKCTPLSCTLEKHCNICVKYRRMPFNGTGMDLCYKLYSAEEQYAYGKCLQWQAHTQIKDLKLEDNIQIVDEMKCTKPNGSTIKCHAYWLSDIEGYIWGYFYPLGTSGSYLSFYSLQYLVTVYLKDGTYNECYDQKRYSGKVCLKVNEISQNNEKIDCFRVTATALWYTGFKCFKRHTNTFDFLTLRDYVTVLNS